MIALHRELYPSSVHLHLLERCERVRDTAARAVASIDQGLRS